MKFINTNCQYYEQNNKCYMLGQPCCEKCGQQLATSSSIQTGNALIQEVATLFKLLKLQKGTYTNSRKPR